MTEDDIMARRLRALSEDHWHGAEAHERIARELYVAAMGHAVDRSPAGSTGLIQRTALALLQSAVLLANADNSYQQKGLEG